MKNSGFDNAAKLGCATSRCRLVVALARDQVPHAAPGTLYIPPPARNQVNMTVEDGSRAHFSLKRGLRAISRQSRLSSSVHSLLSFWWSQKILEPHCILARCGNFPLSGDTHHLVLLADCISPAFHFNHCTTVRHLVSSNSFGTLGSLVPGPQSTFRVKSAIPALDQHSSIFLSTNCFSAAEREFHRL